MAIAITHIQGEASTANTQSVVHATSFTPVAGRTYLFVARFTRGSTMSGATPTTTHGGSGLTLTRITGCDVLSQEGVIASGCLLTAFIGTATGSPTGGVFTTDSSIATTMSSVQYELFEMTGNDTTTPVPQDDVLQENNTTDGTLTLTLAGSFVGTGSYTFSALSISNGTTDPVVPTGWTGLSNRTNSAPNGRLVCAYTAGNDSTADWTGASTGGTEDLAGFIVEIAATVGGSSDILIQGLHAIDRGWGSQTAARLGGLIEG